MDANYVLPEDDSWALLPAADGHDDIWIDMRTCLDSIPCSHNVRDHFGQEYHLRLPQIQKLYTERGLLVPRHFSKYVRSSPIGMKVEKPICGYPAEHVSASDTKQNEIEATAKSDRTAANAALVDAHSKRTHSAHTKKRLYPRPPDGRGDVPSWRCT